MTTTILFDALGYPDPLASITQHKVPACTIHSSKGTYIDPARVDTHFNGNKAVSGIDCTTLESAIRSAESLGFEIIERTKDGHNLPVIKLQHKATAEYLERQRQSEEVEWKDAVPCFVRYGDLPEAGRSHNHRDNTPEDGVSVFKAERLAGGRARVIFEHQYSYGTFLMLKDRPAYFVEGEEVGVGSDGEPLLVNAIIVGAVVVTE